MIPPRKLQITIEAEAAVVQEVARQSLTPRAHSLDANLLAAPANIAGLLSNLQITRRVLVTTGAPGSRFEADSELASEGVCATRRFARRYSTRGVHQRRHSDTQGVAKQ